jgi:ribokinase
VTLHVVGNLCIDTTLSVPRFPVPGETLVALGSRSGFGGKGLNQAVAAARAGAAVVLHAAVGEGMAAAAARAFAGEERLTLRLAELDLPADTSTVLVRPDGENLIVSATACAQAFGPQPEELGLLSGDHLLMQGNLRLEITAACLAEARRRGTVTVLNPSPSWDAAPPWGEVDLVVLNAGELQALSGQEDPDAGAQTLMGRGAGALVVTLGRRGALLFSGGERYFATAPEVEARDASGAGDVFCGVFAALLARGFDRGEALGRASAAASLSVTREGALASCPTALELAALSVPSVTRSFR